MVDDAVAQDSFAALVARIVALEVRAVLVGGAVMVGLALVRAARNGISLERGQAGADGLGVDDLALRVDAARTRMACLIWVYEPAMCEWIASVAARATAHSHMVDDLAGSSDAALSDARICTSVAHTVHIRWAVNMVIAFASLAVAEWIS